MADSDNALDILIRTLADTAGADKVQAALDRATKGTVDEGKANEEASKHAEKNEFSHRQLHKIFHSLSEVVPGLGQAMMFTLGAAAGGTAVLVEGIKVLAGWIEKIREKYKEAAEASAEVWRAGQDDSAKAITAAADYARTLEEIATATDQVKAAEDRERAVLEAIEHARMKILEAQEKEAMAAANGDKMAEADVQRRFGKAKTAEQLAAEQDSIQQMEENRNKAEATAKEAMAKSEAARGAYHNALQPGAPGQSEAAMAAAELKANEAKLPKAILAKQDAERALASPVYTAGIFGPSDLGVAADRERQRAALDAATKAVTDEMVAEQQARQAVEARKQAVDRLAEEQKKADEKLATANKSLEDLENQIKQAKAVAGVHAQAAGAVADEARKGEAERAGLSNPRLAGAVRGWQADIEAEEGRAHGRKMSQDQAAGIRTLVATLKAAGNGQDAINKILQNMMDIHISHEQKLQTIANALNVVRAQIASSPNRQ